MRSITGIGDLGRQIDGINDVGPYGEQLLRSMYFYHA
jgi:hypothetical protein